MAIHAAEATLPLGPLNTSPPHEMLTNMQTSRLILDNGLLLLRLTWLLRRALMGLLIHGSRW
jgi:hypothetical protein